MRPVVDLWDTDIAAPIGYTSLLKTESVDNCEMILVDSQMVRTGEVEVIGSGVLLCGQDKKNEVRTYEVEVSESGVLYHEGVVESGPPLT